ncbi:Gfo/Idh/MocA family protein [Sphingobium agri]|uniref:Gfo/Idh/MocA family oxidoreductase n=1 Tax=Sphingobium agri TaxID=2933566 RepID=A0ABT0DW46_9SPHN|nr:Gfo/Idh/MocA family oxidoreductase [Sphingobium agri]MCK0531338.1 Gfo/Idh/MocA family oxidoreductase [Sphingobium agri]
MNLSSSEALASAITLPRPRLGFLGVGWIGRNRMEAMLATGGIEAAAIADALPGNTADAALLAPDAAQLDSLDALLEQYLDGIVIATPSALHAEQSIRALERGIPVFCQKPLGRSIAEVEAVIAAAKASDRLLGVDLSYRGTEGIRAIKQQVDAGELGPIHAIDLTFHNAYGPDKPWFYDPKLSGGGCMMDLGVHLIDLALWTLGFPQVDHIDADLFSKGHPLTDRDSQVEDFGIATVRLTNGCVVRIACSWHLPAGQDAVITADFFGGKAGAAFRNVNGSFYDFKAELFHGTARQTLAEPGDAWGGQMASAWATQLARSPRFDPQCESLAAVAAVMDGIYAASLR